jgi:Uma2 family endonuclease
MTTAHVQLPLSGTIAGFRRFSVAEYHHLIEIGFLTEDDPVELIEGYLVMKMPRNPPHDSTLYRLSTRLTRAVPPGWQVRCQMAVTLDESEPEPDLALVQGGDNAFDTSHPGPADIALVVEVADTTLPGDRADKGRIYARAAIPEYWIVNLRDRVVEVYTRPSGPASDPAYAQRTDHGPGTTLSVSLGGNLVTQLTVDELLP